MGLLPSSALRQKEYAVFFCVSHEKQPGPRDLRPESAQRHTEQEHLPLAGSPVCWLLTKKTPFLDGDVWLETILV